MIGAALRGAARRLASTPVARSGAPGLRPPGSCVGMCSTVSDDIRNVAIVAHVDHGKTTLVDRILRQCAIDVAEERAMDSMSLERERCAAAGGNRGLPARARHPLNRGRPEPRGITIMSKVTSVTHDGKLINVVDTPGHAAFGGEVERVMQMVDGVVLVVCATEGPNTQTKFVTQVRAAAARGWVARPRATLRVRQHAAPCPPAAPQKALQHGLRPIVVLNKVDRPTSRISEVENEVFDLLVSLDASDEQLDFPILYASAKDGWATDNHEDVESRRDMMPLLVRRAAPRCPSPLPACARPPPDSPRHPPVVRRPLRPPSRPRAWTRRPPSPCWRPCSATTPSSAACSPAASARGRAASTPRSTFSTERAPPWRRARSRGS